MSKLLQRMLLEIGIQLGFTLIQRLQKHIEKTIPITDESQYGRRSTDVPLSSKSGLDSNVRPD